MPLHARHPGGVVRSLVDDLLELLDDVRDGLGVTDNLHGARRVIDERIKRHDRQDRLQGLCRGNPGQPLDSGRTGLCRKIGISDYKFVTMTHRPEMAQ